MNVTVKIGWKFALALGLDVIGIILAVKLDPNAAKDVSVHAIDAIKEWSSRRTLR